MTTYLTESSSESRVSPGDDSRFAASVAATKAVLAMMSARWPNRAESIQAWRNAYTEVLCGQRPSDKPLLTPEEIKTVASEVMRDWMSPSLFPLPGTFGKVVDGYLAEKRKSGAAQAGGDKRQALSQAAYSAGKMFRQWSYVYERYPDEKRYYTATRPNGETIFMKNGEPMVVDHWCNAEHFRGLYDDAMRELTGDSEAQRTVETLVAKVGPWAPPDAPVRPVRGFRTLGHALTANPVPGGPGAAAVAARAEVAEQVAEPEPSEATG